MSPRPHVGRLDRALHRVAFATQHAHLGIADLEERIFRRELQSTALGPPVFITSLPRAGTTMLLNVLAGCPEFAVHTYRDLPFLLCPMIWRGFARRFARAGQPRERAHGDGIPVGLDSPESFEEILWSTFWPEHYGGHAIPPWRSCDRPAFTEFFACHRRKVVALRVRDEPRARRYLSKNNLNIARLPALWTAVPEARVVVPFREPIQQAASLVRQHLRFTALHRDDAFARRYMADIGHHEFGANLCPIDFDGWFGARTHADPLQLSFWLEYWQATYRHLLQLANDARLTFVDADGLARTRDVAALALRLDIADVAQLRSQSERLHPTPPHDVDLARVPVALRAEVQAIHLALSVRARQESPSGSRS